MLFHPERLDRHFVLRAFVGLMPLFRRRAAHHELAAGNRHHLELRLGARHLLDVGPHAGRVGGLGLGNVDHRFGQPFGRGPGEKLRLGLGDLFEFGCAGQRRLGSRLVGRFVGRAA